MEKGQFNFKRNSLYKITFEREFRPGDAGTYVTSFLTETKWHLEFGHPVDVNKNRTVSGVVGLRWEDIQAVEPVSDAETEFWKASAAEFMESVIREKGADICHEDISLITNPKFQIETCRKSC